MTNRKRRPVWDDSIGPEGLQGQTGGKVHGCSALLFQSGRIFILCEGTSSRFVNGPFSYVNFFCLIEEFVGKVDTVTSVQHFEKSPQVPFTGLHLSAHNHHYVSNGLNG